MVGKVMVTRVSMPAEGNSRGPQYDRRDALTTPCRTLKVYLTVPQASATRRFADWKKYKTSDNVF